MSYFDLIIDMQQTLLVYVPIIRYMCL